MFRDAQLVRWLEAIGFDRPTIALAVFQRRTGLRRPTEEQAIRRTPVGRESQLFEEYLARGFTKTQAQQKLTKRLRGSEAPASAAVRMAAQRYVERAKSLNENLATPLQSEPVSHALTLLFRALPDEPATTVRQHAIVVRDALQSVSRQRVEAILVSHWGLVPVFPWTTDSEIRSAVKALRTMMRPQPQGGRDPVTAARPIPLEPFSDALISLLLTLTDPRDAGVGRSALALRTTFMPATAS